MNKKVTMVVCGCLIIMSSLLGCGKEDDLQKYICIGDYKEIKLDGVSMGDVSEKEIDQYIDEIRLRNAEEMQIENEPAKEGDIVYIDFMAKVEDEDFEEISEDNFMLTIGMGEIAESLDQSIIGHSVGDSFEFVGKFSNDFYNVASYYNEDMAGKEATFEITIKSISRIKLPELNDEFVKNVSEKSRTVKEYRKEIRKFLMEDCINEIDVKAMVWKVVVNGSKIKKYPEKELEKYIQRREKYYKRMAEDYGITYDEFIKNEMGSSKKEFEKRIQEEAKNSLKEQLVAKEIAKKENIKVNSDDEKILEEAAWENDCVDIEHLKEKMSKEELDDIVLLQSVKTWLAENCEIDF